MNLRQRRLHVCAHMTSPSYVQQSISVNKIIYSREHAYTPLQDASIRSPLISPPRAPHSFLLTDYRLLPPCNSARLHHSSHPLHLLLHTAAIYCLLLPLRRWRRREDRRVHEAQHAAAVMKPVKCRRGWMDERTDGWRAGGKGARAQQEVEEEKMRWKWSAVWRDWSQKSRLQKTLFNTGLYFVSSHLPPHPLPSSTCQCQMMQCAINSKCVNSAFFFRQSSPYTQYIWMRILHTHQEAASRRYLTPPDGLGWKKRKGKRSLLKKWQKLGRVLICREWERRGERSNSKKKTRVEEKNLFPLIKSWESRPAFNYNFHVFYFIELY